MGQSSTRSVNASTSSQFDEPQTFMAKAVSIDYRLTVMKTDHVRVGLDAVVVGIDRYGEEIGMLNHWLMRGAQMDMSEEILEKSKYYDDLVYGGILTKEFDIKEEHKTRKLKVYFVKFPRCSGKPEELQKLTQSFRAIFDKAKEDQVQQLGIPIIQTSTIMSFPRGQFCQALVEETFNTIKDWKQSFRSQGSTSTKMNFVYLASEVSGCRIMCKQLIEFCEKDEINQYIDDEQEDDNEDLLNSSVEFIKGEEDKINFKAIQGKNPEKNPVEEEEDDIQNLKHRPPSVTRKSFLKSVKFSKM